ncbi:MAG TPA: hypothetical protein VGF48_18030 [Thermoanaerobaculia bacterium]|jgi:hypothetical protein
MALTYTFQLSLLFDESVPDDFGSWGYVAANAVDNAQGINAQLIATKRTNAFNGHAFPASMLTATVIFPADGGAASPNLTLQGIKMFEGGAESGSVSAASPELADQIGGTFTFAKGLLIISPPAQAPALRAVAGGARAAADR